MLKSPRLNAKGYVIGLVIVVLLMGGAMARLGAFLGPPVGDLTRVSGLSEVDYGWQGAMSGFLQNYYFYADETAGLINDEKADIVIFGDSFSAPQEGNITWINTLYAQTGKRIVLRDLTDLRAVKRYLQDMDFRDNPAPVVIVEMAERTIFRRALPLMGESNCALPVPPQPVKREPVDVPKINWERRDTFYDIDELMSWGALAMRLRLFASGKTIVSGLLRDDLFTSRLSDELLIFRSEVTRHQKYAFGSMTREQVSQRVVCAMRDVINSAPVGTSVYYVLPPDKRSVYEEWIIEALPDKYVKFLDELPPYFAGHYIDIYSPLLSDVRAGVKDVYFPNDTHWSAHGHERVGHVVAQFISKD